LQASPVWQVAAHFGALCLLHLFSFLALTGRKIREQELGLEFSDTGKWSSMGEAAEARRSDFQGEALQLLHEHGPLTPSDYAHATCRKRATAKIQLSLTNESTSLLN